MVPAQHGANTAIARERLMRELKREGITDTRVLDAMNRIPREQFVAPAFKAEAYENAALPIGENQTISQPYVVARMTEALALEKNHRVLEIGTGCGYQTAVLCKLARRVFTIERFQSLSVCADKRLHELGISNFVRMVGDGTLGWPEQAPFERIIVTAGAPVTPDTLIDQLAPEGVMVIPVGATDQKLLRICKLADGSTQEELLGHVRFVPLIGRHGAQNRQAG